MNELIALLQENNRLLHEIRAMLIMQCSESYQAQQDMKAFSINVAADIFVEQLENNPELKDRLANTFK